jgi:hypothetical protein
MTVRLLIFGTRATVSEDGEKFSRPSQRRIGGDCPVPLNGVFGAASIVECACRQYLSAGGGAFGVPPRNSRRSIAMNNSRTAWLARAVTLGIVVSSLASCADPSYPSNASNGPQFGSSVDVVGGGGPQDDFARQIYHPGSGTDW